ncbi:MAG TPA: serine/threonine-protein kinase [Polyangiaceae bacterium]|jgi:serine/threonine-protein kinase|nr:serine/threonine-protein kinase [Polyangiaceae bacterium]
MSAAARFPLPRSFGRYALFDFIGKGGMAEIYLARQRTELGPARRCVVKQILPELASDPAFSEMLVHEAKLAGRLSHANVVQVFDLGREGERLFIAMEYVEGFDLNDLLRRCSRAKVPFPFELGVHVIGEALKGLDYAHRRTDDEGRPLGLVHRDVSPSNLLVSFEGEVKVCDFGIARANDVLAGDGAAAHELGEALKGKAGYMSPEHARGEAIDARADVFAAGIVLWELTAGRRMYRTGDGRPSLLELARAAEIPELPRKGLPAEDKLRAVIARALSPSREARYPSASAMQRDLDAYAASAKMMTSPLALGEWLTKTFGEDIVDRRRARERASEALEKGAPLVLQPIAAAPAPALAVVARPAPAAVALDAPRGGLARLPRSAIAAVVLVVLAVVVAAVLAATRG